MYGGFCNLRVVKIYLGVMGVVHVMLGGFATGAMFSCSREVECAVLVEVLAN